ncbi:LADA_0G13938g1_1 [Lachancea dasiensis]|uniref:LADA_0G13938g1_1 n=1 Tax=Lachancea dasiensis TaxID=1072105 RepID=A0A1G4JVZ8_9SACH|nr:LADA_0G13938g1_1 [Lachancea dasiensis]
MGKGAAKYGMKSGILPEARAILKNPTVRQTDVLQKLKAPKAKGTDGVGFAKNIDHPRGSHRFPPQTKFVDVEKLIASTVPEPQQPKVPKTSQQEAKQNKAQIRRSYLSDSFRKEEQRVLRQAELLKEKEARLHEEKQLELATLNQSRSSDLTVPTLHNLLSGPLIRPRTPEEQEILQMKRKQNRDVLQLKAKERRLDNLLKLYHVTDEFIVTEGQLMKKIEEAFANESSEALRTKLSVGTARPRTKNEKALGDALFGSLGGGNFVGLPSIKDYVSGEMNTFARDVERKNQALQEQRKTNMDTIL